MIFGLLGGVLAAIGVDFGSFLGRPERILGSFWATLAAFWTTTPKTFPRGAKRPQEAPKGTPRLTQSGPKTERQHHSGAECRILQKSRSCQWKCMIFNEQSIAKLHKIVSHIAFEVIKYEDEAQEGKEAQNEVQITPNEPQKFTRSLAGGTGHG